MTLIEARLFQNINEKIMIKAFQSVTFKKVRPPKHGTFLLHLICDFRR